MIHLLLHRHALPCYDVRAIRLLFGSQMLMLKIPFASSQSDCQYFYKQTKIHHFIPNANGGNYGKYKY